LRTFRLFNRTVCLVLCGGVLFGCGYVNQFADVYAEYNIQAEQAQEKMLVLNVLRAQKRRPMEFQTFHLMQAQATAAAEAFLNLPFGPLNKQGPRGLQLVAGPNSNQNQIQIDALDTQEFYNGLMRPIELSFVDLYVKDRYPIEQLLMLLVHEIKLQDAIEDRDAEGKTPHFTADLNDPGVEFVNRPGNDFQFDTFQVFLDHLLEEHGLTIEKFSIRTNVGPPVSSATDAAGLKDIANGLRIVRTQTNTQGGAGGRTGKGDQGGYQLQKVNDVFQFCFRTNGTCLLDGHEPNVLKRDFGDEKLLLRELAKAIDMDCTRIARHPGGEDLFRHYCGGDDPKEYADKEYVKCRLVVNNHELQVIAKSDKFQTPTSCCEYVVKLANKFDNHNCIINRYFIYYNFLPRFVENVIYYFGEISRRQLEPGTGWPLRIERMKIRSSPEESYGSIKCPPDSEPNGERSLECKDMFVLHRASDLRDPPIAVEYDHEIYGLARQPNTSDALDFSFSNLEIGKQLFALNLKATTLPTTINAQILAPP
jgi:hypothetical protein